MNLRSFIAGLLVGAVMSAVVVVAVDTGNKNPKESESVSDSDTGNNNSKESESVSNSYTGNKKSKKSVPDPVTKSQSVYGIALDGLAKYGDVRLFDQPKSYENKSATSFMVTYVLCDNAAVAREDDDQLSGYYSGKNVVILGHDFYKEQIIKMNNPEWVGSYHVNEYVLALRNETIPIIYGSMQ